MRAGFRGDAQAFLFCAPNQRHGTARRKDERYERGCLEFAREANHQLDRFRFRFGRAGAEPRLVFSWIGFPQFRISGLDRSRKFRVDQQRSIERSEHGHRGAQIVFGDIRKFRHARRHQKTLEAECARMCQARAVRRHCRAQRRPKSRHSPSISCALRRAWLPSAAAVVVAGMLLSGMSISVVTPPAAAARVAVSKPSQSVRPGSLMWTCVSTRPGMTTDSPAS